jgi:hypothetical protein
MMVEDPVSARMRIAEVMPMIKGRPGIFIGGILEGRLRILLIARKAASLSVYIRTVMVTGRDRMTLKIAESSA